MPVFTDPHLTPQACEITAELAALGCNEHAARQLAARAVYGYLANRGTAPDDDLDDLTDEHRAAAFTIMMSLGSLHMETTGRNFYDSGPASRYASRAVREALNPDSVRV